MKNIKAKKRWGQNFLVDKNVCNKIVASIDIDGNNKILEIGPGTGAITSLLAAKGCKVTAVEIDSNLCSILSEQNIVNLKIINKDILKTELDAFNHRVVVGNLPYYITTPIIFKLFNSKMKWKEMYFLMQKEVAERIVANPGTKTYGRLTIMTQIFSEVKILFNVSPQVFRPVPEVQSTLVKFTRIDKKIHDFTRFEKIIRNIFNQRRKKFKNCISDDMNLNLSAESELLNKRPEEISVEEYIEIIN